jgi:hypothetical protein
MNKTRTQAYGYTVQTTLIDTTTLDASNIDSNTSYKDTPTPIQTHQTTTILYTKPHNRKWNPKDFVYAYGSQVKDNNTLGAGVINPRGLRTWPHIMHTSPDKPDTIPKRTSLKTGIKNNQ